MQEVYTVQYTVRRKCSSRVVGLCSKTIRTSSVHWVPLYPHCNPEYKLRPQHRPLPLSNFKPLLQKRGYTDNFDMGALIKKKIKFSSYIRKFRVEQLQSHIVWLTASSYMYLCIYMYSLSPHLPQLQPRFSSRQGPPLSSLSGADLKLPQSTFHNPHT